MTLNKLNICMYVCMYLVNWRIFKNNVWLFYSTLYWIFFRSNGKIIVIKDFYALIWTYYIHYPSVQTILAKQLGSLEEWTNYIFSPVKICVSVWCSFWRWWGYRRWSGWNWKLEADKSSLPMNWITKNVKRHRRNLLISANSA